MPRSRRSTAFCSATVRIWETIPKPSPNTISTSDAVARELPASSRESSTSPTVISASPATGNTL